MKLILILFLCLSVLVANARTRLFTPAKSFKKNQHYVSTSFFHWFSTNGGQTKGPWLPYEGRKNWTGETEWWKSQIIQVMRAGIDVLYVHLISQMEEQRVNFFRALFELRKEGYDVPKIAPFLDPIVTWGKTNKFNLAERANKERIVSQYIRFFEQYFSVNTDKYADNYIARVDDKIVLNIWHIWLNFSNVSNFYKADIEKSFAKAFGKKHPVFTNGIYFIGTLLGNSFPFADENLVQFHSQKYFHITDYNGIKTAELKPGYWDQNHRIPGAILKRDGGLHYINAWKKVLNSNAERVYIESWNEYTEGSGIYAANPTNIYRTCGNTNTDLWSVCNDPFEYIKTTYKYASIFKNLKKSNSEILSYDFPRKVLTGATNKYNVIIRNTGYGIWRKSIRLKLLLKNGEKVISKIFPIKTNAKNIYNGIFKGMPVKFNDVFIAPAKKGEYDVLFGLTDKGNDFFGEVITNHIYIISKNEN